MSRKIVNLDVNLMLDTTTVIYKLPASKADALHQHKVAMKSPLRVVFIAY